MVTRTVAEAYSRYRPRSLATISVHERAFIDGNPLCSWVFIDSLHLALAWASHHAVLLDFPLKLASRFDRGFLAGTSPRSDTRKAPLVKLAAR